MKIKFVIYLIITLVIISMGYLVVTHRSIYNNYSLLFIIVSLFVYIFGIVIDKECICAFGYIIGVITVILIRNKYDNIINNDFYLFDWIKLVFKNKIVFINVIGNLILYVPLFIFMKNKVIALLLLILILELLQYIFRLGVFDIIDIALNIVGVLIALIIYKIKNKKWMIKK